MTPFPLTSDMRREWRLAVADRVMPLTLVIIGMLTFLAMLAGQQRIEQRRRSQETLRQDNSLQQRFLESAFAENAAADSAISELTPIQRDRQFELQMSAKSPDLMRYTGGIWWTIYPTSPLSSLSLGATGQWPDRYHHAGSSVARTLRRSVRANPLLATVGAFDLTLLVGAILPLAVIVLTYNVVASDREQGRWPLVELHAPSRARLIVMRCFVRSSALAVVVVAMTAGCTLITEFSALDTAAIRNFLVWISWLIAYLSFWTTLAICVNSLNTSSSGAGLLLFLCWTTFVIAVPSLVQHEVNRRFPMLAPSQLFTMEEEVQQQVEQESEQVWTTFVRENPGIALDSENPQQEYLLRDLAVSQAVRARVRKQLDESYQRFRDRESFLDQAQFLSPVIAWRTAADQSAGTSVRHFLDFAGATSTFHERYLTYFETFSVSGQELSQSDLQAIPRFDPEQIQMELHGLPLMMSAGSLLFWTACAGVCSAWNLRRRISQTRS